MTWLVLRLQFLDNDRAELTDAFGQPEKCLSRDVALRETSELPRSEAIDEIVPKLGGYPLYYGVCDLEVAGPLRRRTRYCRLTIHGSTDQAMDGVGSGPPRIERRKKEMALGSKPVRHYGFFLDDRQVNDRIGEVIARYRDLQQPTEEAANVCSSLWLRLRGGYDDALLGLDEEM